MRKYMFLIIVTIVLIFGVIPMISSTRYVLYESSSDSDSIVILVDDKLDLSQDELNEFGTPVYVCSVRSKEEIATNIDMYGDSCKIMLIVNSNSKIQDCAKSLGLKKIQ